MPDAVIVSAVRTPFGRAYKGRLKEIRPKMWEATLARLSDFDVASDPELGLSGVLSSIDAALKKYVPREWGIEPRLRVSALTRRHLREVITAFLATGEGQHAAPYYRQGTGTINMPNPHPAAVALVHA